MSRIWTIVLALALSCMTFRNESASLIDPNKKEDPVLKVPDLDLSLKDFGLPIFPSSQPTSQPSVAALEDRIKKLEFDVLLLNLEVDILIQRIRELQGKSLPLPLDQKPPIQCQIELPHPQGASRRSTCGGVLSRI